jgi:hypothetical protein
MCIQLPGVWDGLASVNTVESGGRYPEFCQQATSLMAIGTDYPTKRSRSLRLDLFAISPTSDENGRLFSNAMLTIVDYRGRLKADTI